MAIPRFYLLHPPESRLPGVTSWLAEVCGRAGGCVPWDGCDIKRYEYDETGALDVATVSDVVRRFSGPIVLLEKIQQRVRSKLESLVAHRVVVLCVSVCSADDLWNQMECARRAYEEGQPLIPLRELIAHLILKKLATKDMWGGDAKAKCYLWSEDLPKGGFPDDLCNRRQILDVAHFLVGAEVLSTKISQGQTKYALGAKKVVQPILDSKSFESILKARKFFERETTRVSVRRLLES